MWRSGVADQTHGQSFMDQTNAAAQRLFLFEMVGLCPRAGPHPVSGPHPVYSMVRNLRVSTRMTVRERADRLDVIRAAGA